jgi:hypothetical protein
MVAVLNAGTIAKFCPERGLVISWGKKGKEIKCALNTSNAFRQPPQSLTGSVKGAILEKKAAENVEDVKQVLRRHRKLA